MAAGASAGKPKAESFGAQVSRTAGAFLRGLRAGAPQPDPMELERQRQQSRYAAALMAYRRRSAALKTRLVTGGTAAVGGLAIAASSLDGLVTEAPIAVIGGGIAAVGAWQANRGRKGLRQLSPPPPPPPIVGLPMPLPAGSPGAEATARVSGLRSHMVQLLPAVEQLQPQAADEIRQADAATAPALNALVERIRFLQQIIDDMPGSPAAKAAAISIEALQIRLNEGAGAYQELLAAVIELSTAPAISGGPRTTLRPAIGELRAYAAGLAAVERTWV